MQKVAGKQLDNIARAKGQPRPIDSELPEVPQHRCPGCKQMTIYPPEECVICQALLAARSNGKKLPEWDKREWED